MAVSNIRSNSMYDTGPIYSTNIQIEKKPKRTCGPVPISDYSCEDFKSHTTLSKLPTGLFEEMKTWKPEKEIFGQSVSWKPIPTIFDKKIMLNTRKVSLTLPKSRPVAISTSSKNKTPKTDQDKVLTVQDKTSTTVVEKSNRIVKFKGVPSKAASLDNTKNFATKNQSSLQKNTHLNAAKWLTSKVTARRAVTRNRALYLRQVMTTLSTYPPFPGGEIPTKEPEPTEVELCGVAKCLSMAWTVPGEGGPNRKLLKTFKPTHKLRAKDSSVDR